MPLQRAELVRVSNHPAAPGRRTLKRHKCRAPASGLTLARNRLADSLNRTSADLSAH